MTYRSGFAFALLIVFSLFVSEAYADIGAVGSPVVPSNLPKPPKKGNPMNAPSTAPINASESPDSVQERTPILSIDFSQRHVYFDKEIRQAIESSESNQPGSTYEVISQVPSGSADKTKAERLNEDYGQNLNDVILKMQDAGVQPSRIHSSTQPADEVTSQQIQIFVGTADSVNPQ
jgi:hypothetical protein